MFPVHTGNIVFSATFCFQHANYAYATRQGILTKIRACEHLQKFCEHEQASTYLIFASNSSEGQILRALSNWMGPFDTPTFSFYNFLGSFAKRSVRAGALRVKKEGPMFQLRYLIFGDIFFNTAPGVKR